MQKNETKIEKLLLFSLINSIYFVLYCTKIIIFHWVLVSWTNLVMRCYVTYWDLMCARMESRLSDYFYSHIRGLLSKSVRMKDTNSVVTLCTNCFFNVHFWIEGRSSDNTNRDIYHFSNSAFPFWPFYIPLVILSSFDCFDTLIFRLLRHSCWSWSVK